MLEASKSSDSRSDDSDSIDEAEVDRIFRERQLFKQAKDELEN
jgi:hypothetical protein